MVEIFQDAMFSLHLHCCSPLLSSGWNWRSNAERYFSPYVNGDVPFLWFLCMLRCLEKGCRVTTANRGVMLSQVVFMNDLWLALWLV